MRNGRERHVLLLRHAALCPCLGIVLALAARVHAGSVFAKYALAACIKTALQLQGFDVGDAIAPQEALKPEAVEDIRRALAQLQ